MDRRLCLITGSGALVPEVIASARARGHELQVLSLSARRMPAGVPVVPFDLADPGPALEAARSFRPDIIALVGAVTLGDTTREGLATFASGEPGRPAGDTALSRLANVLEYHTGARLVGIHEIVPELLATAGVIAGPAPATELAQSAIFAIDLARRAGRLDLGQAIVVSGRRAIALEDIAGTDALLRRVAGYRRRAMAGDGQAQLVLAKAAKPDQPLSIDLPTIGPTTVSNAARAGIALIAVQTGAALLTQRRRLETRATEAGICILGVAVADG